MQIKYPTQITLLIVFVLAVCNLTASAQASLSRKQAEAFAAAELKTRLAAHKPEAEAEWAAKQIKYKEYTLKFTTQIFGDKPADGRSLYISLHGGGGTTARANDQQWENQKKLYNLKEGVYFVPRSPANTWNMWHDYPMDELISKVVKDAITMEDVNPDKIYVMGYSAGGDGVFQLGPRLADYWAAASMMAGHPGDAQIMNLMNLPYSLFVGGKDAAYKRNELVPQWGKRLDSLQAIYKNKFIHETYVYPDLPHWMNRNDTIAVPWMAGFKRVALPKEIYWVQDDILRNQFYWLGMEISQAKQGLTAHVSVKGNDITILDNQNQTLYIYLNDGILNLDKKVSVIINGKKVFNEKLRRNTDIIRQSIAARFDKSLIFSAKLAIIGGKVTMN